MTALGHQEIIQDQGVAAGAVHVSDPEVVPDHQTVGEDEAARLPNRYHAVEAVVAADLAHLNALAQDPDLDQKVVLEVKHQPQNVVPGQDRSQDPRHLPKINVLS